MLFMLLFKIFCIILLNLVLKWTILETDWSSRSESDIFKTFSHIINNFFFFFLDPNFIKTSTTETPLDPRTLQTPDPEDMTNIRGEK